MVCLVKKEERLNKNTLRSKVLVNDLGCIPYLLDYIEPIIL